MFLWLAGLTVICTVIATGFEVFNVGSAESLRTLWETTIMFFVSCSGVGLMQWIMTASRVFGVHLGRYRKRASPIRVGAWMHAREYTEGNPIAAFSSVEVPKYPWSQAFRLWAAIGIFLCSAFLLPNLAKLELNQRLSHRQSSHPELSRHPDLARPDLYGHSGYRMYSEPPMIGPANQPSSIVGWTFVSLGGIGTGLFGFPCVAPPHCRGNIAWLGLGYDGGMYETPWTPILCRLTYDWRLELSSAGGLPMCIIQDSR